MYWQPMLGKTTRTENGFRYRVVGAVICALLIGFMWMMVLAPVSAVASEPRLEPVDSGDRADLPKPRPDLGPAGTSAPPAAGADGSSALHWDAVELTESTPVMEVGRWPFGPAGALALDRTRNLAFLALGSTICILKTSGLPNASPEWVGILDAKDSISGVYYADGYLYAVSSGPISGSTTASELRIINVSNPTQPTELGRCSLPGTYLDPELEVRLMVAGGHAYIAADRGGLRIVDVSNPNRPTALSSFKTSDRALDVAVLGSYAYVAALGAGLQIIDINDPAHPTKGPTLEVPNMDSALLVHADNHYIYVVGEEKGKYTSGLLSIIDVNDPLHPVKVGECGTTFYISAFNVADGYAYIGWNEPHSGRGIKIIEVRNPKHPFAIGDILTGYSPESMTIVGSYAYVRIYYGMKIIDISDLTHANEIGSVVWPDTENIGIYTSGDYIYTITGNDSYDYYYDGSYEGNLIIYKSDHRAFPDMRGSLYIGYGTGAIDVVGTYAYVGTRKDYGGPYCYEKGCGENELLIIDVSNPAQPAEVASFKTSAGVYGIHVVGTRAYVVDALGGLTILDFTDPTHPAQVGFLEVGSSARGVRVGGTLAYVTAGQDGLRIIDVSDPARPSEVGALNTAIPATDVQLVGQFAYVATFDYVSWARAIVIVDIIDPAHPKEVNTLNDMGHGMAIAGDYAYVAGLTDRARVLDLKDPTQPREVGFLDADSDSVVYATDRHVYFTSAKTRIINRYEDTGALKVTLKPKAASTAGAKWTVGMGNWLDSGTVLAGIAAGRNTITFKKALGWKSPRVQTVAIETGRVKSRTVQYKKE